MFKDITSQLAHPGSPCAMRMCHAHPGSPCAMHIQDGRVPCSSGIVVCHAHLGLPCAMRIRDGHVPCASRITVCHECVDFSTGQHWAAGAVCSFCILLFVPGDRRRVMAICSRAADWPLWRIWQALGTDFPTAASPFSHRRWPCFGDNSTQEHTQTFPWG